MAEIKVNAVSQFFNWTRFLIVKSFLRNFSRKLLAVSDCLDLDSEYFCESFKLPYVFQFTQNTAYVLDCWDVIQKSLQ